MPKTIFLTREPDDFGSSYEHCSLCDTPTPFWYAPKDVPVCEECSKVFTIKDIPTKLQWATAVEKLHPVLMRKSPMALAGA